MAYTGAVGIRGRAKAPAPWPGTRHGIRATGPLASLSFAIRPARTWALRQSAESPRSLALHHLANATLRAQGADNNRLGGQLERCRRASASCATRPLRRTRNSPC